MYNELQEMKAVKEENKQLKEEIKDYKELHKLILKFANRIARNVDINETGIARVGITTAERFPKNK